MEVMRPLLLVVRAKGYKGKGLQKKCSLAGKKPKPSTGFPNSPQVTRLFAKECRWMKPHRAAACTDPDGVRLLIFL